MSSKDCEKEDQPESHYLDYATLQQTGWETWELEYWSLDNVMCCLLLGKNKFFSDEFAGPKTVACFADSRVFNQSLRHQQYSVLISDICSNC